MGIEFSGVRYYYITVLNDLAKRAQEVRGRIAAAARGAGRDPAGVRLVAVTKTVGVERLREAHGAGLREFGENRLREALEKAAGLSGLDIAWHMVGHLQRNKAKDAVGMFMLIHSVDSAALLRLLNRFASEAGLVQRVLIQVNLSGEPQKSGVPEAGLDELYEESLALGAVSVEGLMTMPPYDPDPEASRPYYRGLRELAEKMGLRELSMGMTGDFEVAVEEGATIVRVGSAIFGTR